MVIGHPAKSRLKSKETSVGGSKKITKSWESIAPLLASASAHLFASR